MWARLVLIVFLAALLPPGSPTVSVHRGDELFNGKEALKGRIRDQDEALPPEAVRCVNCHGANASAGLSRRVAPHLDRSLLLEFHQRRGGPPSRYNQAGFCKLLHRGIDPAYVLIAREMPVYDLDDAQCASLWMFLAEPDDAAKKRPANDKATANEKQ